LKHVCNIGAFGWVVPVSANPCRWWNVRTLGRHPLTRRVDRLQAWAVVAGIVLLIVAAHQAAGYSDTAYAERSQTLAAEAATHHPVEATALSASTSVAKGPVSAETLVYPDHVQWFANNATHDEVVNVDHPVRAGERVGIWLDDKGKVTTSPPSNDVAHADAIGMAAVLWLLCLAAVAAALVILRRVFDRARHRGWDRDLRLLVDNGGGSSTTRKP
jgi:hypothetical protein